MKLRNGFVSNSSTCSFLVYGVMETTSDIGDLLRKKGILSPDSEEGDACAEWVWDENVEKLFSEKNLTIQSVYEGEEIIIGRSWGTVKDDETGLQFKDGVKKGIEEIFGKEMAEKCDTVDGAYPC